MWGNGVSMPEFRPFVDRAPEYEIRDGVMCVDFGTWSMHMPLRVFRLAQSRALKAVRDHDTAGSVVQIRGKR